MRHRSVIKLSAVAAAVITLTALIGVPRATAAPAPTSFGFTLSTGLIPHPFDPSISDYVTRCQAGVPLEVDVSVPPGHEGLVDRTGSDVTFGAPEILSYGQEFSVTDVDLQSGTGQTYYVRCLPPDFPNFTATRSGKPQAGYYLVAPSAVSPGSQHYVALFDDDGTPVWWMAYTSNFGDFTLLPNGDVAVVHYLPSGPVQENNLDGLLSRLIPVDGYTNIDLHELQLLPDGSYLLAVQTTKPADESFMTCGNQTGAAKTIVADDIITEVRPNGTVAWSWDTLDHVPLNATDPNFYCSILANGANGGLGSTGYDNFHFNSAADDGADVLISYRNLSSVLLVDKATGQIVWKLGGSPVPGVQNLGFVNDQYSNFGGQHDARFYFTPSGANVTVHDDGTGQRRPPRAVRYEIDAVNHTATLVDQVTDPMVTASGCCGSAREMPQFHGDWIMSWGANQIVTELSFDGLQRPFLLEWTDPGVFSYRAEPVARTVLSLNALRSDMNVQFPRP